MKSRFVFIFYALVCCNVSIGQRVTSVEAISKARQFANSSNIIKGTSTTIDSLNMMPVIENGDTLLFLIKSQAQTIIVPGIKCLPPVLGVIGFSSNNVDDYYEMPGSNYFLNRYANFVKTAIGRNTREVSSQWERNEYNEPTRSILVEPLITTKWTQDASNHGGDPVAYNYYVEETCEDCLSDVSPLGCGAVAMGQVMNYWKYPVLQMNKKASEQIDWCNMPDSLNAGETDYEKKRNAVARLLRDCGLACDMSYCFRGGCQSFAWPRDVRKALVEDFSYSSDAILITRSDYPDFVWKEMLIEQLVQKRPVIYANLLHDTNASFLSGYDGHIHICDGYKETENMFHFNMGWGDDNDDWYNIDEFIVDEDNFNWFERAIINIYPLEGAELCEYDLALSNYYHFYYNIYENDEPAPYLNIPTVGNILYSVPESQSIPPSWRTIPSGATAEYVAHKEVILLPGFTAEYGSDFTARIEPCAACEERMVQVDMLTDGDDWQGIDTSQMEMRLYKKGDTTILFQPSALTLFPNPASNTLTVQAPNPAEDIQVFDLAGHRVYRWYIESRTEGTTILNIADIPTGNYILRIQTKDGKSHIGRFAKK